MHLFTIQRKKNRMTQEKQSLLKSLKERLARTEEVIEITKRIAASSYYYRRHYSEYKREINKYIGEVRRLKITIDVLER